MIPNTKDRELASSPIAASAKFGISLKDSPFIMSILRDQIYSDKIMAVLREYSANAWDANRMAGRGDKPITVVVPTSMAPTLSIRDYGPGLSLDEVMTVYTQYGASTKRDNDDAVGMLGIGSKSGFAYSDSFTITSWHDKKKRIYVAALDQSEAGVINLIHEEDCKDDETGIEISIAVRSNDVLEFHNKARKLFTHFDPQPEINIELPPPPSAATKLKHGFITDQPMNGGTHLWVATMGCIPYRVDLSQLRAENNNGNGIAEYLFRVSGSLYLNIGDVQISASREELKYSERTKQALISKFAVLVDEFVQHTFDSLEQGTLTFWERRLKAMTLAAMKLPIPKKYSYITKDSIDVDYEPKHFKFTVHGGSVRSIAIDTRSKLVLRDSDKLLTGFHLDWRDYLVEKVDGSTWDEVEVEIQEMLKKIDLVGMPIEKISTRPWWTNEKQRKKLQKKANKKHLVTTFVLTPGTGTGFYNPWSNWWSIVEREPQPEDVYVLINKFKGDGFDFYALYSEDMKIAKQLGKSLPQVYGYKTTEKAPFDTKKVKGMEYRVWREEWVKTLMSPKQLKLFNYWEWAQSPENSYHDYNNLPSKTAITGIIARFGGDHMISDFFKRQLAARRVFKAGKMKREFLQVLAWMKERVYKETKSEYEKRLDDILDTYPLLRAEGITSLWHRDTEAWFEYIEMVDKFNKLIVE